jgi:hypothetical protein
MTISPKHTRALMRTALFAILAAVVTHTRADPDLFGNVRFGADVIAARSAVVPDAYSFTSDGTFVNHEWLSEAVLAVAFSVGGASGLIVIKLALLLITGWALVATLAHAGVREGRGDLLIAVAAVATFPQTNQVRAQLFSLALFACVLLVLMVGRRKPLALIWLVPIMAVWPNLHGGWIVAAGTIGAWSAFALALDIRSRRAWTAAGWSAVALAATMLNPWGWRMWSFLYETVGINRSDIRDWQPPFQLGLSYGMLWLLVAVIAVGSVAAAAGRRSIDWRAIAVALMLGVASSRVNRLTAFFALATVMLLGPQLVHWLDKLREARPESVPTRTAAAIAALVAAMVIAGAATLSARNVTCISMEGELFPEPELASVVRRLDLHGRMLNWFDYGHYAIWHFSPALKVSIDGRRETLYSKEVLDEHLAFYFEPDSRRKTIDALKPDYIWMPTRLDVVNDLIRDGWMPLFQGPQSTLLSNPANPLNPVNPANLLNPVNLANPGSRCFPGP